MSGTRVLSLLAEPVGAPRNGTFPLRLKPLNQNQASELYALIEAEALRERSASPSSEPLLMRTLALNPEAARRALGSVSLPTTPSTPPDFDPRKTAPLQSWDPKRTAPTAWAITQPPRPGEAPRAPEPPKPPVVSVQPPKPPPLPKLPALSIPTPGGPPSSDSEIIARAAAALGDDPKRTVPSAVWARQAAAAGAAAVAARKTTEDEIVGEGSDRTMLDPQVRADAKLPPAPPSAPWDDGPSLSVHVLYEPPDSAKAPPSSVTPKQTLPAPPSSSGGPGDFFDTALGGLSSVGAPPSEEAPETPASWEDDERAPWDEDEDFATLVKLPGEVLPLMPRRGGMDGSSKVLVDTSALARGSRPPTTRRSKPPLGLEDRPSRRPPTDGSDPLLSRKINDGKYVIESLIGSGAAGAVYKAQHRELRRTVAIKVLHPHYQKDPHFMKGFRGEALAASQLDHPNVMRVLDFGQEPDGLVYIVMEYLSGRTLQNRLDEERRLAPERALELMIQVCAALSVAHDQGIIHRDVKPDNIMLVTSRNDEGTTFELVKVCDFGIAALQNARADDPELGFGDNVIAGTPEYMSPEQARGTEVDARADVYACGICLYELVTGRPPFLGETAPDILLQQLEDPPRPPSQIIRGLDPVLEEIILRAIQKDPEKRQQSARELRLELKELLDPGDGDETDGENERSIVLNVANLDDPASGFSAFFMALSSAVLRAGRFERGHPEAAAAMKDLLKATRVALRGRRELTFARRDTQKSIGYVVMSGHAEIVDLKRLLGTELYENLGYPFIETVVKKGIASFTLREGVPDNEVEEFIELLIGSLSEEELRKALLAKNLPHVSVLFVDDILAADRSVSWKVGVTLSRLARDLGGIANSRGVSLKKMRENRDDLVAAVAHLLTRGEEIRQFVLNADIVDSAVANYRGFSGFQLVPVLVERLLLDPCAEAAMLLVADFDSAESDVDHLKGLLRLFATRLLLERSATSDAAVAELHRRSIVTDSDIPRDLGEKIRAETLANALLREPSGFLRTLDIIHDDDYGRELGHLEAAMAVLARKAEAAALLAAISVLARHARGSGQPGPRQQHAIATMKSIIDRERLVPIATALFNGPPQQREPARQLLVLAGGAGAHALFVARENFSDPQSRQVFVQTLRDTGAAGWSLLSAVLPRMVVQNEKDVAFAEDLLQAVPDRADPALGDAVAKFVAHPPLRPAALRALVALWGDGAKKPLVEALGSGDEATRIVALRGLRRLRGIDDHVLGVVERLLGTKGGAGEELRAAAASILAETPPMLRTRAVNLLSKIIEGRRGIVAMLRGEGATEDSPIVAEAMARSLLVLDRNEGIRVLKARIARSEGAMRTRLSAVLQGS
ncbi:protein kinase domain-containing protein [Labilithrix luteola]|uniref:protein kinase domain-containing protein n=1 Tax=Labilithrix luteola TaxID=1391654 RepID=UPI00196A1A47|nr:protein kinase [Labilithrix luteola]